MEPRRSSALPRVIVVGGRSRAGIAFRELVAELRPFEVTVLVRRLDKALPGEQVVVVEDYFSPPDDVLEGAEAIVNFAGIPDNRPSSELIRVNVEGPKRLAMKAHVCGIKHFVQISSLHVYGNPKRIDRSTVEGPLSAYARSKLAGDMALSVLQTRDFGITLLRMPMHYGPGAGRKIHVLAHIITKLRWFPVPKTVVQRSMVHLGNLSAAIVAVLNRKVYGVQFVADPEPFTYETLRNSLRLHTGLTIRLIRLPHVFFLPVRLLAPGIYRRLYQDNVIAPELVLKPDGGYPITIAVGLKDVVR